MRWWQMRILGVGWLLAAVACSGGDGGTSPAPDGTTTDGAGGAAGIELPAICREAPELVDRCPPDGEPSLLAPVSCDAATVGEITSATAALVAQDCRYRSTVVGAGNLYCCP